MNTRQRGEVVLEALVRRFPLLRLAFRRTSSGLKVANLRILVFHSAFPLIVLVAGIIDNTFTLYSGRGIRDHYGYHALFLSAPALVYLCCWLMRTTARAIADPGFKREDGPAVAVGSLRTKLLRVAARRTPMSLRMLWYFRSVGIAAVMANAASTRYPEFIYGQDVFDSSRHVYGYIAGRMFLAYYWIYLLPYAAYVIYVAVATTVEIVSHVKHGAEYDLRCFASDGCGGFKDLGQLMMITVYMYMPIVIVIVALSHTHRNFYPTLALSAGLAVVIPAQLFLPFLQLHRLLKSLKSQRLSDLERFLTIAEIAILRSSANQHHRPLRHRLTDLPLGSYLRLLAGDTLYRQTVSLSTWPYVRADAVKWVTPFIPIMTSTVLRRYGIL